MTEAETAERGFLITDDQQYLKSYDSAIVRIQETLSLLATLTIDEPGQQELIVALRERVDSRLAELREAIAARMRGGFDAARQAVSTNHGRQLMLEMHARLVCPK